jgi:hypothetical protein
VLEEKLKHLESANLSQETAYEKEIARLENEVKAGKANEQGVIDENKRELEKTLQR